MDNTIRERLNKIYRLAVGGGTEGERQAATNMLHKLLADYGLTLDELIAQVEPIEERDYRYTQAWEQKLLVQIVAKVTDAPVNTYSTGDKRRDKGRVWFRLTATQHEQVAKLYAFYHAAFLEELEIFFSAFVQKHELFRATPPDEQDEAEPSGEMLVWLQRMWAMKRQIPTLPNPLAAQLSDGTIQP